MEIRTYDPLQSTYTEHTKTINNLRKTNYDITYDMIKNINQIFKKHNMPKLSKRSIVTSNIKQNIFNKSHMKVNEAAQRAFILILFT